MSPTCQKSIIFHFTLFPLQFVHFASFKETSQINGVDIAQTSVLGVAASNNEEFIAYGCRSMESSCTGLGCTFSDRNLSPTHSEKVVDPKIIKIAYSLSSINYQIGIEQFCSMVGPLPRCSLVRFRIDLNPLLRVPIQNVDSIKSLFVCSAPSKNYHSIILFIVVHCAVGSVWGDISFGFDFSPLHGNSVEGPDVVHITWI